MIRVVRTEPETRRPATTIRVVHTEPETRRPATSIRVIPLDASGKIEPDEDAPLNVIDLDVVDLDD
jgi:hypothetical protein